MTAGESGADSVLRAVAESTAGATGEDFLRALMRSAAEVLGVRYAFMAELNESAPEVACMLDFWDGEKFLGRQPFALAGTPCEEVLRTGEIRCYPEHAADLFPRDRPLTQLGVQSYLAVPLIGGAGKVIGHFAIMDNRPMRVEPDDVNVLRLFALRGGAELERRRYRDALEASRRRMEAVLTSAMDAIVAVDAARRIQLFNSAAERIFACSASWAIGQPLERFISRRFRSLLDDNLKSVDAGGQQIWIPEGMTAVRANHEEFPIEGTFSAVESGGEKLYTMILRDVNERHRTEAELTRVKQQNALLREEMQRQSGCENILGDSPAMQQVREAIATVASSDATVLIKGETGTGKELVAHAIHNLSARNEKLLVKMNCAALPGELIESEMFGHEKGAFTGALSERKGRFEMANGGTLFLDEVGELTPQAQAKLLRVLQEHEFERVGGSRTLRVDVRVLAASNRDLAEMVQVGTFRSDLYYRLNVFPIEVPPLRAHAGDVPLLARHFLDKFARKLGRTLSGIDADSMQRLTRYAWPGNVRELQNIIERAAVLATGAVVAINDPLPQMAIAAARQTFEPRTLEEVEAAHIRNVLETTDWVIEGRRGAAAVLDLEPSTLRYRMQKLGIRRPNARAAALSDPS